MTSYKELMMKRDAFLALRQRIDRALTGDKVEHPYATEFDKSTGDMLVTRMYNGVKRTHRITITEEPVNVPRETSPRQEG